MYSGPDSGILQHIVHIIVSHCYAYFNVINVKKIRTHKNERKTTEVSHCADCGSRSPNVFVLLSFHLPFWFDVTLSPCTDSQTTESKTLIHIIKHCNRINITFTRNAIKMNWKWKQNRRRRKIVEQEKETENNLKYFFLLWHYIHWHWLRLHIKNSWRTTNEKVYRRQRHSARYELLLLLWEKYKNKNIDQQQIQFGAYSVPSKCSNSTVKHL